MASLTILILEAIGLLIVLAGASELLAKGSHILEYKFGAGFTGSVILGFITMLPELIFVLVVVRAAVSISPGAEQDELLDVALGSAVGGNILLFTLGYGAVILIAYWRHNTHIKLPVTLKDDLLYLLVSSLYLFFTSLKGEFMLYDGIILFGIYIVFAIHQYYETRGLMEKDHDSSADHPLEDAPNRKKWIRSVLFMVFGSIFLILAAEPFVHSIIGISKIMGISPILLALIISPIASELPEKISAFSLSYKSIRGAEIGVANFIGSKVQASTLLFGGMIIYKVVATSTPFPVGNNFVQLMLAIITTLVGVWISYDFKLKLKEGWLVLGLYAVSVTIAILTLK